MVFFQHSMWVFYPASVLGDPRLVHGQFDLFLMRTPFNFYFNGNFAVTVFFILSGFVLSYPFFKKVKLDFIFASMVRRIPRLFLPILAAVFFAVALINFHCFYNMEVFPYTGSYLLSDVGTAIPAWSEIFKVAAQSFFIPDAYPNYNPVLWTMPIELYGSFLTFCLLFIFWAGGVRWLLYGLALILTWNSYIFLFVAGIVLSDLKSHHPRILELVFSRYTRPFFLIVIFILGAYPYYIIPQSFYQYLQWGGLMYKNAHILAAFLLLGVVLNSKALQYFFTMRPILFLGHISFLFYLLHHVILFSLGSFVFLKLLPYFSYFGASVLAILASLVASILLALLMTKWVDQPAIRLSHKTYQVLKRIVNRASINHSS